MGNGRVLPAQRWIYWDIGDPAGRCQVEKTAIWGEQASDGPPVPLAAR